MGCDLAAEPWLTDAAGVTDTGCATGTELCISEVILKLLIFFQIMLTEKPSDT
jgi:hypothetical protein